MVVVAGDVNFSPDLVAMVAAEAADAALMAGFSLYTLQVKTTGQREERMHFLRRWQTSPYPWEEWMSQFT